MEHKLFVSISGLIADIAGCTGIVMYFIGMPIITVICASITIIDSIVQVVWGGQNNFITEVIAIIIGIIVGYVFNIHIVNSISLVLCIFCTVFLVIGLIPLIRIMLKR